MSADRERRIRPATVADAEAMLAIYRPVVLNTAISFELVPPTVEQFADRVRATTETDPWLVSEDRGEVAGYAYAAPFRSRPAYSATRETTIYVRADHRGTGVARELMEALLAMLVQRQVHTVIAAIVLPNEASIALHEGLGFVHVGTLRQVGRKFERWHDLGFWQRGLP